MTDMCIMLPGAVNSMKQNRPLNLKPEVRQHGSSAHSVSLTTHVTGVPSVLCRGAVSHVIAVHCDTDTSHLHYDGGIAHVHVTKAIQHLAFLYIAYLQPMQSSHYHILLVQECSQLIALCQYMSESCMRGHIEWLKQVPEPFHMPGAAVHEHAEALRLQQLAGEEQQRQAQATFRVRVCPVIFAHSYKL